MFDNRCQEPKNRMSQLECFVRQGAPNSNGIKFLLSKSITKFCGGVPTETIPVHSKSPWSVRASDCLLLSDVGWWTTSRIGKIATPLFYNPVSRLIESRRQRTYLVKGFYALIVFQIDEALAVFADEEFSRLWCAFARRVNLLHRHVHMSDSPFHIELSICSFDSTMYSWSRYTSSSWDGSCVWDVRNGSCSSKKSKRESNQRRSQEHFDRKVKRKEKKRNPRRQVLSRRRRKN